MAIVVKDRVKVTTATTGTGTLTLGSAETDFQAFSVIGDGNQTYYAIKSDAGWEVGIGTYTHSGTTLSRDTILESSNSGSAVSLTGTSTVFTTYPAERASFSDQGLSKTFTADGSITAGKPTILTSAGKAKEISSSTSYDANPTTAVSLDTSFYGNSSTVSEGGMAYESTSGTYVVFSPNNNNSQYPTLMAGTLSNGTMTWGTPEVVMSSTTIAFSNQICAGNGKIYVAFHHYDGSYWHLYARWYTISGTTFTANSGGNVVVQTHSTTRQISAPCGYDANADRVIFGYAVNDSTTKDLYYRTAEVSSTGFTNFGTALSIGSTKNADNNDVSINLTHDDNAQRWVLSWLDGSTVYPEACVLEVGSSTITKGSDVSLISEMGTEARAIAGAYDSVNNKITLLWRSDESSSGYAYYTTILTVNSATNALTFTTPAQIFSPNTGDGYNIKYDTNASKFLVILNKQAPTYDNDLYLLTFTSNGSALTLTDTTQVSSSKMEGNIAGATSSNGTVFWGELDNGSNNSATITAYFGATTTTNLDNNYLGVASTTASDTEEVKINLPSGSINNSQTGLTQLSKYYVQTDGSISTTSSDVYAGLAISSTQLLMNQDSGSSGSGLTLTLASGESVTAGDAVGVNSSGEAQKAISATSSTLTTGTAIETWGSTQTNNNTDGNYVGTITGNIYITTRHQYGYPKLIAGTLASDGTLTYGSAVTLGDSTGTSCVTEQKNYNGDTCVIWSMMDSTTKFYSYSISGTTLTEQFNTTVDGVYQGDNCMFMQSGIMTGSSTNISGWGSGASGEYDASYVVYTKGSAWADHGIYCRVMYCGSSSNSGYYISFSSEMTVRTGYGWTTYPSTSSLGAGNRAVWNETDQQLVVSMRTSGFDGGSINIKSYKQNGSTASSGLTSVDSSNGALDLTASSGNNGRSAETTVFDMTWDKQNNKIVCFGVRGGSESSNPYGNVGWTINCESNDHPSIAKSDAIATAPTTLNDAKWFKCVYSDTSKEIYCIQAYDADSGTSDDALYFQAVTLSGNDITMGNWSDKAVEASGLNTDFANYATGSNLIVDPVTNLCVLQYFNENTSYYTDTKAFGYIFTDASGGFIGVSQTSASSGDITVNVIGQTDANQTGLTAGSKVYYDSSTGGFTATATNNTEVGTALSATQFLFNKQP